MILYFSATGNSEYAARYLADLLADSAAESLTPYIRSGESPAFSSEKPYVILSPVYVSTIPDVVLQTLGRASFSGNPNVYFIMTCAGDRSASGYFASELCRKKNLRYMGTAHLSMPQDYLMYFTTKGEAENREKLEKAEKALPALADLIRREVPFAEKKPGRLHVMVIRPVAALFRKYFIRPQKFQTDGRCVSCGLCEKVCPLGNIRLKDGRPLWGENCIHCTACINRCPRKAIEYGRGTRGKPRYTAPRYRKR